VRTGTGRWEESAEGKEDKEGKARVVVVERGRGSSDTSFYRTTLATICLGKLHQLEAPLKSSGQTPLVLSPNLSTSSALFFKDEVLRVLIATHQM
jgi:hypothetical protein